jgi:hypothetical protein
MSWLAGVGAPSLADERIGPLPFFRPGDSHPVGMDEFLPGPPFHERSELWRVQLRTSSRIV